MKKRTFDAEQVYLDWFNNYLTVEKLAEHYNIPVSQAEILINAGRIIHYKKTVGEK